MNFMSTMRQRKRPLEKEPPSLADGETVFDWDSPPTKDVDEMFVPATVPRWLVDSKLTKQVFMRIAAWALACGFGAWATLTLWGRTDPRAVLLTAAVWLAIGFLATHLSTKKLRAIEVLVDDWVQ